MYMIKNEGGWPAGGQATNGCLKIYLFSSSTSRFSGHTARLGKTTTFGASDGPPLRARASMMARPRFHGHRQLSKPMEARGSGRTITPRRTPTPKQPNIDGSVVSKHPMDRKDAVCMLGTAWREENGHLAPRNAQSAARWSSPQLLETAARRRERVRRSS